MSLEKFEPHTDRNSWTDLPYDRLAERGLLPEGGQEKPAVYTGGALELFRQGRKPINQGPQDDLERKAAERRGSSMRQQAAQNTYIDRANQDELERRRLERAQRFLESQKPLSAYQDLLRRRALEGLKKAK